MNLYSKYFLCVNGECELKKSLTLVQHGRVFWSKPKMSWILLLEFTSLTGSSVSTVAGAHNRCGVVYLLASSRSICDWKILDKTCPFVSTIAVSISCCCHTLCFIMTEPAGQLLGAALEQQGLKCLFEGYLSSGFWWSGWHCLFILPYFIQASGIWICNSLVPGWLFLLYRSDLYAVIAISIWIDIDLWEQKIIVGDLFVAEISCWIRFKPTLNSTERAKIRRMKWYKTDKTTNVSTCDGQSDSSEQLSGWEATSFWCLEWHRAPSRVCCQLSLIWWFFLSEYVFRSAV